MKHYEIGCYIKNKLIYKIELQMTEERFKMQLHENRLHYVSSVANEIIYLDKFDLIRINEVGE